MLTHKISFRSPHLSITEFPEIELPDFTLITGLNGTGKSHLLQAISQGKLGTTAAPGQHPTNQTDQVRLYDWSTMIPNDSAPVGSDGVREARRYIWNVLNSALQQNNYISTLSQELREFNLPQPFASNPLMLNFKDENLTGNLIGPHNLSAFREKIESLISRHEAAYFANYIDVNTRAVLEKIATKNKLKISMLKEEDIMNQKNITWNQVDLFQQSFASMFIEYRDLKLENYIKETQFEKGATNERPLTESAFITQFGLPPWDLVNAILEASNLLFRIDQPNTWRYEPYKPELIKISTGQKVTFGTLSSGEKILMSFAFCVYLSSDNRNITNPPKVLLFDEIDASLHPSMSRNLINIIQDVLVKKFSIKVIMATHSPSTVALAPEDSIFTMRSGFPGLYKTPKAAALNILTDGVPTLSISFEDRRQVFVESTNDAKIYSKIYERIKSALNSDRSIEFIPTGIKKESGEDIHTGCLVVKELVERLSVAGNKSAFGIIDWDNSNEPNNRLAVLAHKQCNALENVLLDPLLVGLFIALEWPSHKEKIGLSESEFFADLFEKGEHRLQELANEVGYKIFKRMPGKMFRKKYVGGLEILMDEQAAVMDDKSYKNEIFGAFPFLRDTEAKHKLGGGLMGRVTDLILANQKNLVPIEIKNVFLEILNKPTHSDEP